MKRHLDDELTKLKETLLHMGSTVEEMVCLAIRTVVERKDELSSQVFTHEERVNHMQMEVDEFCVRVLALYQPEAADLRFILASMKMNAELERIADQAVNMAQTAHFHLLKEPGVHFFSEISRMGELARQMVRESLDAYTRQDVASAQSILIKDAAQLKEFGAGVIKEKYGNLFDMYKQITGVDPYEEPMQIYPAVHYTMGGLWVDYNLMTTVPGLYALGEANFSDHGANRLGASALMQGLADGYFVIPYTIGDYLADEIRTKAISTDHPAFVATEKEVEDKIQKLLNIKGTKSVDHYHKRLGKIMWDKCGMARNSEGLKTAIAEIQQIKAEFWSNVRVPGEANEFNQELEKAGRVADFIELGELMCKDALERNESCGGHFREEYQTNEGEALRDDVNFAFVAAWENQENGWKLHKEELKFENIKIAARSYK